MAAPFEVWFHSVPPITRTYIVGIALTTLACVRTVACKLRSRPETQLTHHAAGLRAGGERGLQHLKLVSPWDLYLNYKLVARGEVCLGRKAAGAGLHHLS